MKTFEERIKDLTYEELRRLNRTIEEVEELKSAMTVIRKEYADKISPCKIPILDKDENRKLGIRPANRLSSLLAMYKELANDTNEKPISL